MTFTRKLLTIFVLPILLVFTGCAPVQNTPPEDMTPGATSEPQATPEAEITPENGTPFSRATATLSPIQQYYLPAYYSPFYGQIIEDSKKEGRLIIYSIMDERNWAPVVQAFRERYPWIDVSTFDLDASEVFQRYNDQVDAGTPTADMLVSSDYKSWQEIIRDGAVLTYRSQEDGYLPAWSKASFGVYALSSDPMVIIYNESLVQSPPDTMQEVGILAQAFQGTYANNIVTYDASLNATGYAINWFWTKYQGESGWNILNAIGNSSPVLMTSGGQMVQAVGNGDDRIGYFVSAITVLPRLAEYPNLRWSYIRDGQPILIRNMAITQQGRHPNSAKLMMDFLLSQEGQLALAQGGLTPYRADISQISSLHLEKIVQDVGQENIILFSLDPDLLNVNQSKAFLSRWLQTLQKGMSENEETEGETQASP